MTDWAPDLLRKCARSFVNEAPLVKMQIVTLAGKLIILAPPPPSPSTSPPPEEPPQSTDPVADEKARKLALLVKYVVHGLARYDAHWDVRDRARLVWGLVRGLVDKYSAMSEEEENGVGGVVLRREQVRVVLFEGKAGGLVDDHERGREVKGAFGALSAFGIGAASEPSKRHQDSDELEDEDDYVKVDETLVLDSFDEDVPEWMEKGVESKLRDSEDDNAATRKPVITAMGSGNFNRGGQASGSVSGAGAGAASSIGPVVLVPTNLAGTSEAVASENKKTWRDLDSFYADTEVVEEVEDSDEDEDSEEDEDEDDGSDDDGEEVSSDGVVARRTADGSGESEEEDSSGAESHDERRALVGQP